VAKERKAPGAAPAKSGGQEAPAAREPDARGRTVYELPKNGDSDLVMLLALRERPPFDDEYVDTQTLARSRSSSN
jgi:hypothetical protein